MVNEKKSDRRLFVRTPLVVLLCVALIFALAPSIPHAGGAASAVGLTQDEWAAAEATNPNPKADEPTTSARTRVTEKATGLFEALGVSGTQGTPGTPEAPGTQEAPGAPGTPRYTEAPKTPNGGADALATGLGSPPVDAVVTALPYSDSQTIDENTHKVTMSAIGTDEMLSYRGYIYKISLTKGAAYSVSMTGDPADSFYSVGFFLDGDSNMIEDLSLDMIFSDGVFTSSRSGTFYLLVTDLGMTTGGKYTMRIERASRITGKVTNGKGKALSDVTVLYYSAKKSMNSSNFIGEAWTDYRGRYSIGVLPGSYKILFLPAGSDVNRPKYTAKYYGNKYSIRRAKVVNVGIGKTRSGVNVKLAAYRAPKADKKIASLPYKHSSGVGVASREVQIANEDYLYRAKVYSVRLLEGRGYEFSLKGRKGSSNPTLWVVDSKGYYAGAFVSVYGDQKTAVGTLTPSKTDNYRVFVLDPGAFSSFKYTLNISSDFTPARITGQVVNRGGHALPGVEAEVYKKRGKRWVSYMWGVVGTDGKYSVDGLAPGEYKVGFGYTEEDYINPSKYYKKGSPGGAKDLSGGSVVKVGEGATVNGIDMRY